MIGLLITFWLAAQQSESPCAACHSEQVEDFASHKHSSANVACATCHGESEKHRKAIGSAPPDRVAAPDEVPALCGACHPDQAKAYTPSKHGKLVLARSETRAANCGTCHGVHAPRWQQAMERQCARCHQALPDSCKARPARVNARLACASCHDPHSLQRR